MAKPKKSGNCEKCAVFRKSLHRDHVIPKCKGGHDGEDNIQWICANCHEDKTRQDFTGFNLTPNRKPVSQESREKMGAAHRGRKHTPEHIEKVASKLRGRTHEGHPHTEETKAKIRAKLTGRPNLKLRGKPFTQEHRRSISAALSGKPKSSSHMQAVWAARRANKRKASSTPSLFDETS